MAAGMLANGGAPEKSSQQITPNEYTSLAAATQQSQTTAETRFSQQAVQRVPRMRASQHEHEKPAKTQQPATHSASEPTELYRAHKR